MPNELRIVFQRSGDHLSYRLETAEPQRFTPFLTADNYEDLRWYLEEFMDLPMGGAEVRARERPRPLTVIAPVPEHWEKSEAPQDPAIKDWIAEMKTEPMKSEYRARKSLVERANAGMKERFGVRQVPVRGGSKVLSLLPAGQHRDQRRAARPLVADVAAPPASRSR